MKTATMELKDVGRALDLLIQSGLRVVAPVRRPNPEGAGVQDVHYFSEIDSGSRADLALGEGLPTMGIKEFFFPKDEPLFAYEKRYKKVTITEVHHEFPKTVIFGVRPCDAAGLGSLNAVFSASNAGFEDTLFTGRRAQATLVTWSCVEPDLSCFCTSVGLSPDSDKGSDLHLTQIDGERLHLEARTPAGEALAGILMPLFRGEGDAEARQRAGEAARAKISRNRDPRQIKTWLDNPANFDDELWARLGEKCLGCGACTFVCPTCHCFDIVDEERGGGGGYRVKFWDSCQFDHFTLHASGHNPRSQQYQRYRNRFSCKFKIYQDAFSENGCVGCGRCIRGCPINLDITEYMLEVANKAARDASVAGRDSE
ncbi:MAG: 4Fe-4S dicluster domain-containing protein [Magnetococcus sp. YQC-3]